MNFGVSRGSQWNWAGMGPGADPSEASDPSGWSCMGTVCGRSCPITATQLPLPRLPFAFSQLNNTLLLKIPRR